MSRGMNKIKIEQCKFFNPKNVSTEIRDKMKICDNFGLFNCSINCGDNSWLFLLLLFPFSVTISNFLAFVLFWEVWNCCRLLLGFSRFFFVHLIHFYCLCGFCFFIIFYTRKRIAYLSIRISCSLFYILNFQWKCFIKIVLVLFPNQMI